jgi:outer membrane protein TolC
LGSARRERADAGTASTLDVRRAEAEVEARRQDVASADYGLQVARRSLRTLTGITPTEGGRALDDDLHDEPPLGAWEAKVDALPAVAAAREDVRAAEANAGAAWAALYPTVVGTASERFTNATAFGQSPAWAAGVSAIWHLDASTIPAAHAQNLAASAARARLDRAVLAGRDAIHASRGASPLGLPWESP